MPFNPFDKPIGEALAVADLQLLISRSVSEGYYVEYKGQMQSNDKIAKSIAALANTHGGWYFVGVEVDKTHNVATNICGFSLSATPDPIATVRDVAKSRISPPPVFYPQVVNMTSDLVVLVVYVPEDQDTPFLTKDGRIYRRIADSSDPVYEKDRYAIDQLYAQGQENVSRFERFCNDSRVFAKSESGVGWVNIFLAPYPNGMLDKKDLLTEKDSLEKLLQRSKEQIAVSLFEKLGISGSVPFTSGQVTHRSVILRQVAPMHVAFNSLTIEFFTDGSAKFFIPLPYAIEVTQCDVPEEVESHVVEKALRSYIATDRTEHSLQYLHFFSMEKLCAAILHLVNYYVDWLRDVPLLTAFKAAVVLNEVWRYAPFADVDEWGWHVAKYGIPIMSTNVVKIPEEIGRGLLLSLEKNASTTIWASLLGSIGLAFGLPQDVLSVLISNSLAKK